MSRCVGAGAGRWPESAVAGHGTEPVPRLSCRCCMVKASHSWAPQTRDGTERCLQRGVSPSGAGREQAGLADPVPPGSGIPCRPWLLPPSCATVAGEPRLEHPHTSTGLLLAARSLPRGAVSRCGVLLGFVSARTGVRSVSRLPGEQCHWRGLACRSAGRVAGTGPLPRTQLLGAAVAAPGPGTRGCLFAQEAFIVPDHTLAE